MLQDSPVLQIEKLKTEQTQILEKLARFREALKSEVDIDLAEADPELVNQKVVMTLLQEQERKLKEIDYALQQIQQGAYGICERCGKPIDPERLEIVPETTFCMQCKMIVERKMHRNHTTTAWYSLDDSNGMV